MSKMTVRLIYSILIFTCMAITACSQIDVEQEKKEITALLDEFLTNVDSPEMHDRLWAEDLVYTGSAGIRHGKDVIMNSMQDTIPDSTDESAPTYSFEDLEIKLFGTTAAITFQLVATTPTDSGHVESNYLNSGFFEKRNGNWKAVVWQATKMAKTGID